MQLLLSRSSLSFVPLLCALAGCGDADKSSADPSSPGGDAGQRDDAGDLPGEDGGGDPDAGEPAGGCNADVPCIDEQVAGLMLSDLVSGGAIEEEGTVAGEFSTYIDATAGGVGGVKGYTYARFTADGLEPVELSDEQAFESADWDIAFRRYIIRLNSGVSGPSCVLAARVEGESFDDLGAVPAGLSFEPEQYFTSDTCEFVPDTSGIGAPQTLLGGFWSYPGCVAMTGNVYVLQLASGGHVKLQVTSYYAPDKQQACDQGGAGDSASAANIRVRWALLD